MGPGTIRGLIINVVCCVYAQLSSARTRPNPLRYNIITDISDIITSLFFRFDCIISYESTSYMIIYQKFLLLIWKSHTNPDKSNLFWKWKILFPAINLLSHYACPRSLKVMCGSSRKRCDMICFVNGFLNTWGDSF